MLNKSSWAHINHFLSLIIFQQEVLREIRYIQNPYWLSKLLTLFLLILVCCKGIMSLHSRLCSSFTDWVQVHCEHMVYYKLPSVGYKYYHYRLNDYNYIHCTWSFRAGWLVWMAQHFQIYDRSFKRTLTLPPGSSLSTPLAIFWALSLEVLCAISFVYLFWMSSKPHCV